MKIFMSGQITNIPYRKAVKRFAKAKEVLLSSVTAEHIAMNVINPLDLTIEHMPRKKCMAICIDTLLRCEAIYRLRGWELSPGAWVESQIAHQLELEIWDEL